MTQSPHPHQNALLAAFEGLDVTPLLAQLEPVELPLGQVLADSGCMSRYVYFPTTAIVSLTCLIENGASVEVAAVGNEGVVGVSVFMGGGSTTCNAVVQSAGLGYRVGAQAMKQAFECGGPVMHILLRYTQALLTQMSQAAVCNRHHSLERQLSRWLLHTLDRLPGNDMVITQHLIAKALGVRREGVTEGAMKLQKAGLIRYARGHITVLDRHGLEQHACECYALVAKECDRLRPEPMAA